MNIRFLHIQSTDIEIKVKTYDKDVASELNTTLKIGHLFDNENKKKFAVIFDVHLQNKQFKLKLKSTAHFATDEDITDEFMESSFVKVNAPAIAFPYIRSFISIITLNAGYDPIVLPAFNFVKLAAENNKKED